MDENRHMASEFFKAPHKNKTNLHACVEEIVESTGLPHSAVMRAVLSLSEKNFVKTHERKRTSIALNDEGKEYARNKLPERRLIKV